MLGLGANISGGSPVGIVGAAAPTPPSDYFYESDFASDSFVSTSVSSSVVDHEGRSDVIKYFNNTLASFNSRNYSVNLSPGSYEIDFWYYVPSGSTFEQLRIYKNLGSTEIIAPDEIQYDQWVNLTHNFNIDKQTFFLILFNASAASSGDSIFISDIKISLNIATSPSPPPGGYYDGALDQSSLSYEGAAAAYSLRLVYSYYDGPAIRVRRASDNAEQDIGFSNGVLDTSTLSTFCSGTDGFVKIWYDQANGNDATQTTTADQWKIYDASTGVSTRSGSVTIERGSSVNILAAVNLGTIAQPIDFFAVQAVQAGTSSARAWRTSSSSINVLIREFENDILLTAGAALISSVISPAPDNGELRLLNGLINSTSSEIYFDGAQVASGDAGTGTINADVNIGGLGTSQLVDSFAEFIIYSSDQSANRTGIQSNINNFYQIYSLEPLLLNEYEGAAAAYSLRQLDNTYSGSAIRVRRASDNAEQDISFVDNQLDTSALITFCAGTNGFVVTWYDQSGNANDATQATTSEQPKIYDSIEGIILEGSKPSVEFISSLNSNLSISQTLSFISGNFVFSIDQNQNNILTSEFGLTTGGSYIFVSPTVISFDGNTSLNEEARMSLNGAGFTGYAENQDGTYNLNEHYSLFFNYDTSRNMFSEFNAIGSLTSSFNFDGKIQEIVFYPTDQSANRAGIETNINDHYNIYE